MDHNLHKLCEECGQVFFMRKRDGMKTFSGRKFCSKSCANNNSGEKRKRPLIERFWKNVSKPEGVGGGQCWAWIGPTDQNGYGNIDLDGAKNGRIKVHRLSWEISKGPIPKGKVVMHICDNPNCVNPAHLRIGTQKDNIRDRSSKGRINPNSFLNLRPGKAGVVGAGPLSRREIGELNA